MIEINQNQKENANSIIWSLLALRDLVPVIIEIKERGEHGSYIMLSAKLYAGNLLNLLLETQRLGTFGQFCDIKNLSDIYLSNAFISNLKQIEDSNDFSCCYDKVTKKIFLDGIHSLLINVQSKGFNQENKLAANLLKEATVQDYIADMNNENISIQ